jgi:CheY-like chemotaxis protein
MLKQTLEGEGYQVIPARTALRASGSLPTADWTGATDLKLPKKDGFEVLRAVKQENPLCRSS